MQGFVKIKRLWKMQKQVIIVRNLPESVIVERGQRTADAVTTLIRPRFPSELPANVAPMV